MLHIVDLVKHFKFTGNRKYKNFQKLHLRYVFRKSRMIQDKSRIIILQWVILYKVDFSKKVDCASLIHNPVVKRNTKCICIYTYINGGIFKISIYSH